jgi:hypothetical protein
MLVRHAKVNKKLGFSDQQRWQAIENCQLVGLDPPAT